MKIRATQPYWKCNDETLDGFERYCGLCLPVRYRGLLKSRNGFVLETSAGELHRYLMQAVFPIKPPCEQLTDDQLLPSVEEVMSCRAEELVDELYIDNIHLIPIGESFDRSLVCLDYRELENPAVCIVDCSASVEGAPATSKLASCFDEFSHSDPLLRSLL